LVFVLAVDSENDLEIETKGAVTFVRALIGFDPERGAVYTVTVSFDSGTPMYGVELSFWIEDDLTAEPIWSGLETRFIHGSDRKVVLGLVLTAVKPLVAEANADCVAMTAMAPNLPTRALDKHMKIIAIFSGDGFEVQQKCENGYFSWLLTKA
jgi:hypothetical protein